LLRFGLFSRATSLISDKVVLTNYDDGKTDIAVYRNGTVIYRKAKLDLPASFSALLMIFRFRLITTAIVRRTWRFIAQALGIYREVNQDSPASRSARVP